MGRYRGSRNLDLVAAILANGMLVGKGMRSPKKAAKMFFSVRDELIKDVWHPVPEGSAALDDVERGHIQRVLEAYGWNRSRAAKTLGIDRVTLYNKIKKYGFKKVRAAVNPSTRR